MTSLESNQSSRKKRKLDRLSTQIEERSENVTKLIQLATDALGRKSGADPVLDCLAQMETMDKQKSAIQDDEDFSEDQRTKLLEAIVKRKKALADRVIDLSN